MTDSGIRQRTSPTISGDRVNHMGGENHGSVNNNNQVQSSTWTNILTQTLFLPFNILKFVFQATVATIKFFIKPFLLWTTRAYPSVDRVNFIDIFESKYGSVHPDFLTNQTYKQALVLAKRELKFILIYIHSEQSQYLSQTSTFCSKVLSSQNFIDFLAEHQVLFWATTTDCVEGLNVSNVLKAGNYPSLSLVVQHSPSKMAVVGRIDGLQSCFEECSDNQERLCDVVMSRLLVSIHSSDAHLVTARLDREERLLNQSIREEQDAIFEETLKQDQERDRIKELEREEMEKEKREKQKALDDEQKRISDMAELRKRYAESEYTGHSQPFETDDNDDLTKIVVKLPNGTRLSRYFKSNDKLVSLYKYVFLESQIDYFEISTNFPKRIIPGGLPHFKCLSNSSPSPSDLTLKDADLCGSVLLFVGDLDT